MADDRRRTGADKGPETDAGQTGDRRKAGYAVVSTLSGSMQVPGRPLGAGQSAGGSYPNPQSGKTEQGSQANDKEALTNGGYHGGGQQGDRNWSGQDHHGASKGGDSDKR